MSVDAARAPQGERLPAHWSRAVLGWPTSRSGSRGGTKRPMSLSGWLSPWSVFAVGHQVSRKSHSSPRTQRSADSLPLSMPHSKSVYGPSASAG